MYLGSNIWNKPHGSCFVTQMFIRIPMKHSLQKPSLYTTLWGVGVVDLKHLEEIITFPISLRR